MSLKVEFGSQGAIIFSIVSYGVKCTSSFRSEMWNRVNVWESLLRAIDEKRHSSAAVRLGLIYAEIRTTPTTVVFHTVYYREESQNHNMGCEFVNTLEVGAQDCVSAIQTVIEKLRETLH